MNISYTVNLTPRHTMETGSPNDVYAWCASLPDIGPQPLSLMARQGNYNCILNLFAPEKFLERLRDYLLINREGFRLHCGRVNYQRGALVGKRKLNSHKFRFNVFQKAPKFKEDMEYRMSVINCTFQPLREGHLDLMLGDCSDIISIKELQNFSILLTEVQLR